MRNDMAKVIVERPRRGGEGARFPRQGKPWRAQSDADPGPAREGMRRRWQARNVEKSLNENLAPLERYLHAQVGRPWNHVWRDISQRIRPANAVQQHVRDHVKWIVCLHVFLRDGKPWTRRWGAGRPLGVVRAELYVHPVTGLLRIARPRPAQRPRGRKR